MKQYIVQIIWDDGEMTTSLETARQIIDTIDMSDCYPPIEMKVWEPNKDNWLRELRIHGCWHNPKDPLYIKVTRPDGSIAFDGYGTDH